MSNNIIEDYIDLDSPQVTLAMPLWGRAECTQIYPRFLTDERAVSLHKQLLEWLNLDPSIFKHYLGKKLEYFILTFANRASQFDLKLQEFLARNPEATVINLGAGLDTGFYRNDNSKLMWYELDLPEVIKLRQSFLPETARNRYISSSVLDPKWFEKIDQVKEQNVFLIAGGLFMYFNPDQVRNIFELLKHNFPGAELVFDAVSPLGLKIGNKRTENNTDKTGMFWYYSVSDPDQPVNDNFQDYDVLDHYKYWERTPITNSWSFRTKLMMRISTLLKLAYFIHVKF